MPKSINIAGGKIFYSNDESYLDGIVRGVEYANDGALNIIGITKSDNDQYTMMLVIEDPDDSEIYVEFH